MKHHLGEKHGVKEQTLPFNGKENIRPSAMEKRLQDLKVGSAYQMSVDQRDNSSLTEHPTFKGITVTVL